MAVEYIDHGNDDGTNFGRSDGKIGFYGLTTPIVQDAFDNAAVVTTAGQAITSTTTGAYGLTSSQCASIIALVNEIRAKLVALNLVATA
jgi:hypothetical protein